MNELQNKLQKPLEAHEIDFRVQSIGNKNINGQWQVCAQMLAYKDARCDMKRLDEVFGFDGWQRDYKTVNGLLMCGVSVRSSDEWITKWDVGTESNAEKEKGLASDCFKRANFNLGIGRELYDYPQILVPLRFDENKFNSEYEQYEENGRKKFKAAFGLKPKEWIWFNQFDEDRNLTYLAAKDGESLRFSWGSFTKQEKAA